MSFSSIHPKGRQSACLWAFLALCCGVLFACQPSPPQSTPNIASTPTRNLPSSPSASPTPQPTATQPTSSAQPTPRLLSATLQPLPPDTANLGMRGVLIFTDPQSGIYQIDLAQSFTPTQIWKLPHGDVLKGIALAPDGRLTLAYSTAQTAGTFFTTDLYALDLHTQKLEKLLQRADDLETFYHPFWQADGKRLYYTRTAPLYRNGALISVALRIERVPPADSYDYEILYESAEQLVFSPDKTNNLFIKVDTVGLAQSLWLEQDGQARQLIPSGAFQYLNSPRLSLDGAWAYFLASGELLTAKLPLLPSRKPLPHGAPWDVWRVSIQGGIPEKLSVLGGDNPTLALDPFGSTNFVVHQPGGLVLVSDGKNYLLANPQGYGEVLWLEHAP